jgi:hypothetical protein
MLINVCVQMFDTRNLTAKLLKRCYDTQHNDTQHNDTQYSGTQHNDTEHNDTEHNDTRDSSRALLC